MALAVALEREMCVATRPEVRRALSLIFWAALRRPYQRWAERAGHATRVETVAVTGEPGVSAESHAPVDFVTDPTGWSRSPG